MASYDVVRVILALILLMAAALKGHQLATSLIVETGLLSSRWVLLSVVEIELALGLWLLGGQFPAQSRRVAIACFALFGAMSVFRALRGNASCGCFGAVAINPWLTGAFDFSAVVALRICTPPIGQVPVNELWSRRTAIPLMATVILGTAAAISMVSYQPAVLSNGGDIVDDGTVILCQPMRWLGKPLPLLPYIAAGAALREGTWTLLLYHHDCEACQNALAYFDRTLSTPERERTAFVEIPPYELQHIPPNSSDGDQILVTRLRLGPNWFIAAPVAVTIDNGIVSRVREREQIERLVSGTAG